MLQFSSATNSSILNPNSKPFAPRSRMENMRPVGSSTPIFEYNGGHLKVLSASNSSVGSSSSGISSASSLSSSSVSGLSASDFSLAPRPPKPSAPHRSSIGILERCSTDDLGLRGLARALEAAPSPQSPETSAMTVSDLGFLDYFTQPPSKAVLMDSAFDSGSTSLMSSWDVPEEYYHGWHLADQLNGNGRWPTELLFFFFYFAPGDALQLQAGSELYDRGWRFNKVNGLWIGRYPEHPPEMRTDKFEKGLYQYFDVKSWQRANSYLVLKYDELAERVAPPPGTKQFYQAMQTGAANYARKRREANLKMMYRK